MLIFFLLQKEAIIAFFKLLQNIAAKIGTYFSSVEIHFGSLVMKD